jgi:hypothetical protein
MFDSYEEPEVLPLLCKETAMAEYVPVKAYIPRHLRRRAFAAFAMLDTNYSRWTREHLERWLEELMAHGELMGGDGPGVGRRREVPGE